MSLFSQISYILYIQQYLLIYLAIECYHLFIYYQHLYVHEPNITESVDADVTTILESLK